MIHYVSIICISKPLLFTFYPSQSKALKEVISLTSRPRRELI